jgi:cation diffusion facilitator family transporter
VRGSARFAFGGWKIEVLAAYSSGLLLLGVSVWIAIDAIATLWAPHAIAYTQAIVVAVIGLVVNAVCAVVLMRGDHGHGLAAHAHGGHGHRDDDHHDHDHPAHAPAHGGSSAHPPAAARVHAHAHAPSHAPAHAPAHAEHAPTPHPHGHHDHNYRAATVHVLADALTSVLAVVALVAGLLWGWRWFDPLVALAGGVLIARWAWHVLRDAARSLVDASPDTGLRDAVRSALETDADARVADLHVWQVGPTAWSAVLSVVADRPLPPEAYRARLHAIAGLQHVTIEVHQCRGAAPPPR